MNFLNKLAALANPALPVSAIPIIGRFIATKTVAMRLGSREMISDHSRSRHVSAALFYGRAYRETLASAGLADRSGLPTRYRPTTKNSFDRRAFVGGLI